MFPRNIQQFAQNVWVDFFGGSGPFGLIAEHRNLACLNEVQRFTVLSGEESAFEGGTDELFWGGSKKKRDDPMAMFRCHNSSGILEKPLQECFDQQACENTKIHA